MAGQEMTQEGLKEALIDARGLSGSLSRSLNEWAFSGT